MTYLFRVALFAAGFGLFVTVVQYAGMGLENLSGSEAQAQLRHELDRAAALDLAFEKAGQRLKAKIRIAADLEAGQLTLLQAAACLRDLPDAPRNFWVILHENGKNNSDGEQLCRYVI